MLPEKPEKNWPDFDDERVRSYSKRLGNLALFLARGNSDLRSADFKTKKQVYLETPYVLTSQIGSVKRWTEKEIGDRQKLLSELALKAWPF